MTEKRYFKEDFCDEYAIKKEDTIIAIVDSGTNARKICDELNTLHDENEQLRKLLNIGRTNAKAIIDVLNEQEQYKEENEQLKQEKKELRQYLGWQEMELEELESIKGDVE